MEKFLFQMAKRNMATSVGTLDENVKTQTTINSVPTVMKPFKLVQTPTDGFHVGLVLSPLVFLNLNLFV